MMKVSIIIPTYSRKDVLRLCLMHLYHVLPKKDVEVVVSDDGSTDDTINMLERYKKARGLTYVAHTKNMGRSATRNAGYRASSGDVVAFVDCDIIHLFDPVTPTVELFESVSPGKQDLIVTSSNWFSVWKHKAVLGPRGSDCAMPHGAWIAVRREYVEQIGGYDEELFGARPGEDVDFLSRLLRCGLKNIRTNKICAFHLPVIGPVGQ